MKRMREQGFWQRKASFLRAEGKLIIFNDEVQTKGNVDLELMRVIFLFEACRN